MAAGRGAMAAAGAAMLILVSCGSSSTAPQLMNIRKSGAGPDEFAIVPPRALAMPESVADLPETTPGGANLTDPDPQGDAIAALGGKPGAGAAADAGLMRHAGRYGSAPTIRADLAAEDLAFRQDNRGRPLERLFGLNSYFRAYRRETLDQQAELEYWRARGAGNVSAPPPAQD